MVVGNALKLHAMFLIELPVIAGVTKCDGLDSETHTERPMLVEVVVLVANMDTINFHLHTVEQTEHPGQQLGWWL